VHLELHIGLPRGCRPEPEICRHYSLFRWKDVAATFSGPQARLIGEGHGVDGELGAIGTLKPQTLDTGLALLAELDRNDLPTGSRLEAELAIDPDQSLDPVDLGEVTRSFSQCLGSAWKVVPAPAFEAHTTVATSTAGSDSPSPLLRAVDFFESTAFVDPPRSVITIVGSTAAEVRSRQKALERVLVAHGAGVSSSVTEALVGAWRP